MLQIASLNRQAHSSCQASPSPTAENVPIPLRKDSTQVVGVADPVPEGPLHHTIPIVFVTAKADRAGHYFCDLSQSQMLDKKE